MVALREYETMTTGTRSAAISDAVRRLGLGRAQPDSISELIGRNDNCLVSSYTAGEIFLKFFAGSPFDSSRRFERSLAFEKSVAATTHSLWRSPEFLGAVDEPRVAAYRRIPGAVSANSLMSDGTFHTTLAERCGRAVAEVHSLTNTVHSLKNTECMDGFGPEQVIRRRLRALTIPEYAESSGGELEVWALLQHDRRFQESLDALADASELAPTTVCHGDLRLDQFLVSGDDLFIIDWEEMRLADPAIDIGSFAGEWLHRAAFLMFSDLEADPTGTSAEAHESLVSRGERELDVVRPFIVAFWRGYREQRDDIDDNLAVRATAYAGWHLFDRLLAGAMVRAQISHAERAIAGIGRSALISPGEFTEVIGLTGDRS